MENKRVQVHTSQVDDFPDAFFAFLRIPFVSRSFTVNAVI
jgi:hypothetical protein